MIELHTWGTPNGRKVSIMLEECGLPYSVHKIDISKGEQFKPEFLKISPNNRIPAIVDPDGPGGKPISLFESGAILIYLAEKTGKFLSKNSVQKYRTFEWLMWQMGGVGPMFGQAHHFLRAAPTKIEYGIKRYVDEAKRLYGVLDKQLASNAFAAGADYTIADIASLGQPGESSRTAPDRSYRGKCGLSRSLGDFLLAQGCPVDRQPQHHHCASPRSRADAYRAVVQLGERLRYCKSQSRALMTLGELTLDLLERPSQPRQRVLRNADAGIRDGDADPPARRACADRDATAFRGELYRIG